MAHVRTIEQLYWKLSQAHAQLWASDRAVQHGEEILKREQAKQKEGRGKAADILEAEQRLEQFQLDLVTKTSDVITAERQLRKLLGLSRADDRRIMPGHGSHRRQSSTQTGRSACRSCSRSSRISCDKER